MVSQMKTEIFGFGHHFSVIASTHKFSYFSSFLPHFTNNIKNDISKISPNDALILVGAENIPICSQQAFWQIKSKDDQSKIVGFIPLLHKAEIFHNLPSYPIISFEVSSIQMNPTFFFFFDIPSFFCQKPQQHQHHEGNTKASLVLVTDLDRNTLIPEFADIDEEFTQFLRNLNKLWSSKNWWLLHWNDIEAKDQKTAST